MSVLTGHKWVEAFMELPAPKQTQRAGRRTESPVPSEEGMASQPPGLDVEGNGSQFVVPEGSVGERIDNPNAWSVSLGPDATRVDEVMEETLGDSKDGPEDDGTEQVTLVEYMVWEAWMDWEQSLQEAHWHWWMAEVVTTFGWLLGLEQVGGAWSLSDNFQQKKQLSLQCGGGYMYPNQRDLKKKGWWLMHSAWKGRTEMDKGCHGLVDIVEDNKTTKTEIDKEI